MSTNLPSIGFVCTRCLRQQIARRPSSVPKRLLSSSWSQALSGSSDRSATQIKASGPKIRIQRTVNGILQWRTFMSRPPLRDDDTAPPKAPPPPSRYLSEGVAPLYHRRLIRVSGIDTAKFLQGLVTANIIPDHLFDNGLVYTAFLTAQGRLIADVLLYPWPKTAVTAQRDGIESKGDWGVLIEVDGSSHDALLKHLRRHKLRSKVTLEPIAPESLSVSHQWSPIRDISAPSPNAAIFADPRFRGQGLNHRSLHPPNNHKPTASLADYMLHRYLHGVPEGPVEIPPSSALPLESNIDLLGGIDFRKGCYVGQELTIRTKHTGVVRKRILPIVLSRTPDTAPVDANLLANKYDGSFADISPVAADAPGALAGRNIHAAQTNGTKRGRPTGKLLGSVGNIGLALCRLEKMTDLQVSGESEELATEGVTQLADDEGTLGGPVYVRAVVPEYVRLGVEGGSKGEGNRGGAEGEV